ncbi:MAG: DUF2236 domain-containing protein [Alphaproteobacteria bacterium]|nr:DUF2236 domain-containing protein [Alphaproteobacteria bacterium]
MTLAVDRYRSFHTQGDPLADDVAAGIVAGRIAWPALEAMLAGRPQGPDAPAPLRALADRLWATPLWVDPARLALASEVVQRTGVLGGVVLALYALPLGYLSGAGVKPLVSTGRLVDRAPRRLAETNRFLVEVTRPGGMAPGAEGWRICGRVRVVHALVRQRLQRDPDWRHDAWGLPVNQAHMAGTNLLFSLHGLDGLRTLGVRFSPEEVDALLHLWRAVGHQVGVVDELSCATEADSRRLWATIRAAEAPPDQDSRALARSLIEQAVPAVLGHLLPAGARAPGLVPLLYRLSTALLGRETAAALGYPPVPGPLLAAPLLRTLVGGVESLRGESPRARALLVGLGGRVNAALADAALQAEGPARFDQVA